MKTLPLSEAKMKLSQIIEEVSSLDEEVTITKNGRPVAVLVSSNEHESWQETELILADEDLMEEIRKGLAGLSKDHRLYTLEELFLE